MNAVSTYDQQVPLAADAPTAGRPRLTVAVPSAFAECTCPEDCERDHDNE